MKKFIVSLALLASVSVNAQIALPTYAPNKPLTATVYDKSNTDSMTMSVTAFLSDGSYCSVTTGVGAFASLTGKWQQKGDNIEITLNPVTPMSMLCGSIRQEQRLMCLSAIGLCRVFLHRFWLDLAIKHLQV